MSPRAAAGGAMCLVLAAVGCAGLIPPTGPVATSPSGHRAAGAPAPAAMDSSPSSAALAVLATIPEPLSEAERVPPPGHPDGHPAEPGRGPAPSGGAVAADSAAADTLREDVPVPAPTVPLGERGGAVALPESALVPRVAPAPAASGPAAPDSCFRLQISAPHEKAAAESRRAAATSQLLLPFVIERERGRYKVRSRDCMERAAAEALKDRARRSGFTGAFVLAVPRKP